MFTFRGCKALTELVIPGSVTYIESAAFRDCTALVSIKLPGHFTRLPDVALRNTGFVTYKVPRHITALGAGSLSYCENLEQVIFHEGITEIGNTAFAFTPKLGKLTWPSRVTAVQVSTFESSGLTELVLPATVNELQSYAFHNCASLEKLYVLGDIQNIGDYVFTNCSKLTIYGNSGTKIERYAKQNGIPFVVLNTVGSFLDVSADAFYADSVKWAVEKGITTGTSATEFSPNEACLRSQVVTFLWRAAGEPKAKTAVNPFVDVKPGDYYYDAVLWAVENGITTGADDTHFEPNGICNRSQVVTFLYRAFEKPPVDSAENPFTDVSSGDWYADAVLWAVQEGITNGLSETKFGPNEVCNRSQVVTFLYRTYVN